MKIKYLVLVVMVYSTAFINTSTAQTDGEKLTEELEKMMEEMEQGLQGLDFAMPQIIIDTLIFKDFDTFDLQDSTWTLEGEDMKKVMEQLQQNFQGMDWAPIEEFFKNFNTPSPLVPEPDKIEEKNEKQRTKHKL